MTMLLCLESRTSFYCVESMTIFYCVESRTGFNVWNLSQVFTVLIYDRLLLC